MKKEKYKFSSEHLKYRCICEKDAVILVKWRSDSEIIKYFYNSRPISMASHLKWYHESYLTDMQRYDFIVFDGREPVGFVALTHIDFELKRCEINYTIGNPEYYGKNLGQEMIEALVLFGKSKFAINEFVAQIHRQNIASQRAAEKAGFIKEVESGNYLEYRRRV